MKEYVSSRNSDSVEEIFCSFLGFKVRRVLLGISRHGRDSMGMGVRRLDWGNPMPFRFLARRNQGKAKAIKEVGNSKKKKHDRPSEGGLFKFEIAGIDGISPKNGDGKAESHQRKAYAQNLPDLVVGIVGEKRRGDGGKRQKKDGNPACKTHGSRIQGRKEEQNLFFSCGIRKHRNVDGDNKQNGKKPRNISSTFSDSNIAFSFRSMKLYHYFRLFIDVFSYISICQLLI